MPHERVDPRRIQVLPLAQRTSKHALTEIAVDPDAPPPPAADMTPHVESLAGAIRAARQRGASVVLMYGAHLVKNGLSPVVQRLLEQGWVTHLATNGAGTIHDWEYAFQGRSEEDVARYVAQGRFGTWDETGRHIHLALLVGGAAGTGYGESLGRFIQDEGCTVPSADELAAALASWCASPRDDELMPARAELLQAVLRWRLAAGPRRVPHPHKAFSLTAAALRHGVPLTVHPGIGYDIIYTHPMASGAAAGRGALVDFHTLAHSVGGLDGGVLLSVGSAIMAPQVFEKAMSVANNLRGQRGAGPLRPRVFVNDLAPAAWDWSAGEPPPGHAVYYLRFCKSFSRMGGEMTYVAGDNRVLLPNLLQALR